MEESETDELEILLAQLRLEHKDLDDSIKALEASGQNDYLQLQRLKKKKLSLKDRISQIEDQIFPDIIA